MSEHSWSWLAQQSLACSSSGSGVHRLSYRFRGWTVLVAREVWKHGLAGMLHFCLTILLGSLLLAACGDPPSLASEADQTPTTPQPVLRPRAAATEATTRAATPTTTATPDAPGFVQVAAGENHTCALQHDGTVLCWGRNEDGQLDVPKGARFQQITAGWRFSCGIQTDGRINCWGRNEHEQLDAPDGQFTAIDAGWDHVCALSGASATCWGWNANERAAPPTGVEFTAIGAGAEHSCGLALNGDLKCWGSNDDGRADSHSGPFRKLAVGIAHTCALRTDGTASCQGDNSAGQSHPPGTPFALISAGSEHTCGVLPTGALKCWGGNPGRGINVQLAAPAGLFTSLSAGWKSTCAINKHGHAQCWKYTYEATRIAPYDRLNLTNAFPGYSFPQPTDIFPWPSGGLAVVNREGYISTHIGGTEPRRILDLSDATDSSGAENGMLSAALDPDFGEFPFLYVYYTARGEKEGAKELAKLTRFPIVDGRAVRKKELIILDITRPTRPGSHYGGAIRFGPDGMLYLGIGDAVCFECPQRLDTLHGKIIRIDVRGGSVEQPYRVPADNPLIGTPGARSEIWAYGLRNPWRMAFDPKDGRLWVGDVGQTTEEEVSIAAAGQNLGWPIFEGSTCLTTNGFDFAARFIQSRQWIFVQRI